MDDLRDLYQSVILDHNKAPRNFGAMDPADRKADGHNPLCGDKLTIYLDLAGDGSVADIRFEGVGCAISTASASLMTEYAKGRPAKEILATFERFHDLVTSSMDTEVDTSDLGKLAVFAGVREYPSRVKCATLSWHTLQAALEGENDVATTE
jgi:nitrogen fixation NifU-like protein